ncbi:hypothetical protein AK812_SmicGene168 [Symbiodinium microadriaticum]|uniref:Uncharacterized protein n=1 Tax=Symbiodinium microadriaticum TaxID=2951 RepID=A0A1Q9F761_SYMMI|nr:hypothetical protein AK812_SmicGene168 [Symbiodinium microadriaticum]
MASSTASDLSQEDASSMASADPSEVVVTLLEQHAPHVILQLGAALAVATSGRQSSAVDGTMATKIKSLIDILSVLQVEAADTSINSTSTAEWS